VLPFHQMGRDKWHRIGRPYVLADTPTPSPDLVERVTDQFRAHDLPVR
jgi:pyruvate formate lyase activating enzyme